MKLIMHVALHVTQVVEVEVLGPGDFQVRAASPVRVDSQPFMAPLDPDGKMAPRLSITMQQDIGKAGIRTVLESAILVAREKTADMQRELVSTDPEGSVN